MAFRYFTRTHAAVQFKDICGHIRLKTGFESYGFLQIKH